jgi:exopolyphosphatase/guanosine-5'-triphosphate,3'-diphosphate pyrophosphatase
MLIPTAMDMRSVAHWASRRLETIAHEQRVCRTAATLFDLTAEHHDLPHAARTLLRAAALVHHVGRSVDDDRHPAVGAQMILNDRALPVGQADRRALAFLTLYHRDAVPDCGDELLLTDRDDRAQLRRILALLRTADALDSRSQEVPRLVFCLRRKRLKVTCYLEDPDGKAARTYQRRKKFRLLQTEIGCEVEVEVRAAAKLHRVA